MARLDNKDIARIRRTKETVERKFKFGETEYRSDRLLELPGTIGHTKVFLKTYVVQGDIPWLVGRVTMEKLGTLIDFEKNKVVFRDIGEIVKLREDSGGHLRLRVGRKVTKEEVWGEGLGAMEHKDRVKKIRKLHLQFGHPGADALLRLLAEAKGMNAISTGEWKEIRETVGLVSQNCEICLRYKKTPPRPVVGLTLSRKFNDVIALDLGEYKGRKFMVIVDLKTKYCQACWLGSKKPEEVIRKLVKHWIAIFGSPSSILTDNGREFNNEKFLKMTEAFSIRSLKTAAESPWSNGICEKTVGLVKDSMRKMEADGDKELETILYWTVSARNSLYNKNGFSPNQLVLGKNPNLPGSTENENPAAFRDLDDEEDFIRENLIAIHRSRKIQIAHESDQKIRTALKNQIRSHKIEDAQQGDEIFYKREGEEEWRGPARVVGIDGKTVIVKHGGDLREICRVHITRLARRGEEVLPQAEREQTVTERREKSDTEQNKNENGVSLKKENDSDEDSETEYEAGTTQTREERGGNETEIREGEENVREEISPEIVGQVGDEEGSEAVEPEVTAEETIDEDVIRETNTVVAKIPKLRKGQKIRAYQKGSNETEEFRVTNLAGKRNSRRWGDSYNVVDREGQEKWIDLRQYENITEIDEEDFFGIETEEVMRAKEKEFSSWVENKVYEEVEDRGQKTVGLRWVITNKIKEGELVCKARLVAKGFQEKDVTEKEAPTCAAESFRLCLAVMLIKGWKAKTIDVKTAYLQGERINREVYVKPPVEAATKRIWRLQKTVYGLKDAARAWYDKVNLVMKQLGGAKSAFEPTIFIWRKENGETRGVMCIHVDDILFGGDESFNEIILGLKKVLKVGEIQSEKFSYVGVGIEQNDKEIYLSQDNYVQKVGIPNIDEFEGNQEMRDSEMMVYRGLIGKLNWLAQHTRPDISFEVSRAGCSFQRGTRVEMRDLIKKARKIKETTSRLKMNKVRENEAYWEVFCDAAYGNIAEGLSQIGFTISLKDDSGKLCPIFWKSVRARRVARSPMDAEALSLIEAAEMVMYLNTLWREIVGGENRQVILKTDNRSLYKAIRSRVAVKGRSLRIDMAAIHELIDKGAMVVAWVNTSGQLADALTKEGISRKSIREYMFGRE